MARLLRGPDHLADEHVAYLKREGVTRDGADARVFDATSDDADTRPSPNGARRTGIISGLRCRQRMQAGWQTFALSLGS
jgi:hypothetical protein